MKVLVVATNRERSPFPVAPLGALAVAASARRSGFAVDVVDLSVARSAVRVLRGALRGTAHDVVAFSIRNLDNCFHARPQSYFPDVAQLAGEVRSLTDAPLVLGGSGFSVAPYGWLRRVDADFGVIGEGERTFTALLKHLEAGDRRPLPAGVIMRDAPTDASDETCSQLVEDLDDLPPPSHDECNYTRHIKLGGFVCVQTKRGCPCKCIYCVYPNLEGAAFRLRNPEAVVDEIESVIVRSGVHWFFFSDSVFNMPKWHALEVCRRLADRRVPVRWMAYCNPVGFDDELARAMAAAGCAGVEFGLDAAVEKMLSSLGKPFTQADIHSALTAAAKADLPFAVHLLFGGPTEAAADVAETQRFLDACPRANAVFASVGLRVYKNTPLEGVARREGALAASDDLFEPAFYVAPGLGESPLAVVDDVARRRPEWSSPADWMKLSLRAIRGVMNRLGQRPQWKNARNYGMYVRKQRKVPHVDRVPAR
ncbi:MAG: B12-binding domain-containing radical SAM protein [Phycisphaerae bacterium]